MKQLVIEKRITVRTPSLKYFLDQISKIPLLTVDEEIELCEKMADGCIVSKEKVIMGNLRFVVSVAKQYKNNRIGLIDLIAAGCIGIAHAAEKFEPKRGFKFISYAVWWIRREIIFEIKLSKQVRTPVNIDRNMGLIKKFIEKYLAENYFEPSVSVISESIGIPLAETIRSMPSRFLRLDNPVEDGASTCFSDLIPSNTFRHENTNENDIKKAVCEIISKLEKGDRYIIEQTMKGYSIRPISEEMGLNSEVVRQRKNRLFRKIKKENPNLAQLIIDDNELQTTFH